LHSGKQSKGYNDAMNRRATKWAVHAWIAMLALLFSSLAPAVQHLFNPAPADVQVAEICTSTGSKYIAVATSDAPKPLGGKTHGSAGHCGYCMHGTPQALPPAPAVALALGCERAFLPVQFRAAPAVPFPWTVAFSRAPPTLA
jgi:hypothetical protein